MNPGAAISLMVAPAAVLCLFGVTLIARRWLSAKARAMVAGREELAAAISQAAESVVITDREGRIRYVNPAFTRMTGYRAEEALGQNPRILKSGQQPGPFYEDLWRAILSGRVWQGELVNRRKDGSTYTEEMSITPVCDTKGEITSFIAIKQDVTDLRAAEKARRLLAGIVESSQDAIITHNLSGEVLTWNHGAEMLFGYRADEVLGKSFHMFVRQEDMALLRGLFEVLDHGEAVPPFETAVVGKGGQRIPVSLALFPIKNHEGRATASGVIIRDISTLKKLEDSRLLLAAIVESSQDAIVARTFDGIVASWNRGAEAVFGYGAAEIVGKPFALMVPPERLEEMRHIDNAVAAGERISHFETVRVTKGGRPIDVSISASPIQDGSGAIVGTSAIYRDITERKKSELALREQEERFRAAFEHAPYGMALSSLDLRLLKVNATMCRMLGYSEEELLKLRWEDFTYRDDFDISRRELLHLADKATHSVRFEKRYVHRDGHLVWAHVGVSRVEDRQSGHPHYVVHIEDITARKAAEDAIRESEDRVRLLFDSTAEAIYGIDLKGNCTFANAACLQMTGYRDLESLIGKNMHQTIHHSRNDRSPYPVEECAIYRAFRNGEGSHVDCEVLWRADGSSFPVEYWSYPIRKDGEIVGAVVAFLDITQRRKAESELHESEQRLRVALRFAQMGVWEYDLQTERMMWSPEVARICGVPDGSFGGTIRDCLAAVHPGDREFVGESGRRSIEGSSDFNREFRVLWPDGSVHWVAIHGDTARDENGVRRKILGIAGDITERKETEEALRVSEERYRSLFESLREGVAYSELVFEHDEPCDVLFLAVNGAFEEVTGLKGVAGRRLSEAYPAIIASNREMMSLYARVVRSGDPERLETFVQPVGKWFSISVYRPSEGQFVAVFDDITARKQAEAAREERARLASLAGDIGLCTQSGTLREGLRGACEAVVRHEQAAFAAIWTVNPQTTELELQASAGKFRHAGTPPARLETGCPTVQRIARTGEALIQNRLTEDPGICDPDWARSEGLTALAGYPLLVEGTLVGVAAAFARTAFEPSALQSFAPIANQLAQFIRRKWGEQELREAMESSNAASRAKSRFLANMSHEIRTPLNGVIGLARLLLESGLPEEQRRHAELVLHCGETLLGLTTHVLDLSKIEAGKMELEMSDFDLEALLKGTMDILAPQAARKGVAVEWSLMPGTPARLRGDAGRFRQVIANLATNAMKFTAQGSVSLRGECLRDDGPRAMLRFTIVDTGVGIRKDRAEAIFSPFVQADESTTRKFGGTGLGLTIAKQLVELMGGEIGCESEEGKGSTFWFTVVLEKQPEPNPDPPGDLPKFDSATPIPGLGGGRILLAEDNPVNQEVARSMLGRLGFTVTVASNGAKAIEALRKDDFDIVLMDCGMPEIDGYEAARLIRDPQTGARNPAIPIIAVTASAMPGDREMCLEAGMDDYVSKPIDRQRIMDVISRWLNGRKQTGSIAEALPAMTPAERVFDPDEVLDRLMGNKELARRIIRQFLDDIPRQLCNLQKHLQEGDATAARREAHTLKGAAATVSARALREIACSAEQAAKDGKLDDIPALLPQLEAEAEGFREAVSRAGWL